jgi:protein-L-isoaspartate(D-aspartate) O-methyltransferase
MTLAIAQYQRRLWEDMQKEKGALRDSSPRLEAAYYATPRHQFIRHYRTWLNPQWRSGDLDEIYSDTSLILAGDDNASVVSTASQPSYVLDLVDSLDIRPGDRVLEIGSGCGWLLAVMAHLTGPTGRATGIEILPQLARQSRESLAHLRNVTVHAGDGKGGLPELAPFDKVIATAALATIPAALLDQTAPGARLLLPIACGDETRCDVNLYERAAGRGLVPLDSRQGFFVPMV